MYFMASGRALPLWAVLKMVSNRSSTNFCNVPCRSKESGGTHSLSAQRRVLLLLKVFVPTEPFSTLKPKKDVVCFIIVILFYCDNPN